MGCDSYPPDAGPKAKGAQRDRRNHRRHRRFGLRVGPDQDQVIRVLQRQRIRHRRLRLHRRRSRRAAARPSAGRGPPGLVSALPELELWRFVQAMDLDGPALSLQQLRQRRRHARLARRLPEPRQPLRRAERVRPRHRRHPQPSRRPQGRPRRHPRYLVGLPEPATAIRATIADTYGYDLTRTVDDIRPGYEFNEICQTTVPEAITCALESHSFEDAIRNAISLGGDSDTLAAIAGPIAEALHGIAADIQTTAKARYIPDDILRAMYEVYGIAGV